VNVEECPGCGTTSTAAHACPGKPHWTERVSAVEWSPTIEKEMGEWLTTHGVSFDVGYFSGWAILLCYAKGLPTLTFEPTERVTLSVVKRDPCTDPGGCRWCGVSKYRHVQQWCHARGWHGWEDPPEKIRKERMLLRRQLRLARE
jgi:hypothetical protein